MLQRIVCIAAFGSKLLLGSRKQHGLQQSLQKADPLLLAPPPPPPPSRRRRGDAKLRQAYSQCMQQLLAELGALPVRDILDVGAATGLSSLALLSAFPAAAVTGVDLSPHFVAVGRHLQRQRQRAAGGGRRAAERLALVHAAAEATGLPPASFDLVSVCLVCHELPEAASRAVFREAARLLRPGGALAIMEMNPASEAFQKVLSNPIPYAIFKSTEPYLQDYVSMDLHAAVAAAGFGRPRQLENSPRHRTVVAVKPAEGR
jgi:SAM-dependent methyltransferase